MADPLSITAGVVGLIAFAGSTLSTGYRILRSCKDSGESVRSLLVGLSQLTGVLVAVKAQQESKVLLAEQDQPNSEISKIVDSSLVECRKTMKAVSEILIKLEKSRTLVLATKLLFIEPVVESLLGQIERQKQIFVLCLGIDTRRMTDDLIILQTNVAAQIHDMRSEMANQKIAVEEQRARDDRQALFRWLVPKAEERHEKASRLALTGTGKWVLKHHDYNSWLEGEGSMLWLNGIPGSGKTVLMSRIINNLKQRPSTVKKVSAVTYFYCSYDESKSEGVLQIFCSVAAQLIRSLACPEESLAMRFYHDCDDGTLLPNLTRVQDLLISLANQLETVYLCLDALDEAGDKNGLLEEIINLLTRCNKFKVLLTCRIGDYEVSEFLAGCPCISLTADTLQSDIDLYIRHRIERGSARLRQTQPGLLATKLSEKADGMFLWVSCQIDQLARPNKHSTTEDFLRFLPRDLSATYTRILAQVDSENAVSTARALQWLAHAAVPLSLVELVEAIAVEEDSLSVSGLQKLQVPDDVLEICGSLVRRSGLTEKVNLAHHSVYEFLTSAEKGDNMPVLYHMPKENSMVKLCNTSITYLSFQEFSMARMQAVIDPNLNAQDASPGLVELGNTNHSFFDYALRHWWKHLPSTREGFDQVLPKLLTFFDGETGNFASSIMLLRHIEGSYKYPMSMQPIHFCAINGLPLMLTYLLHDMLIDVECAVEDGRRSLHMAAENGRGEIVEQLLSSGADVDAQSSDGRTPLQLALESGNESIVQLLVSYRAKIETHFANGDTPLSMAVGNGWYSLVEFLLRKGADPNARLSDRRTSLHVAAEVGADYDLFQLLFRAGADQFAGEENDWTPLHFAAHHGHSEAALCLTADSTTGKIFQKIGWNPLHAAVEQEHLPVIEILGQFARGVSDLLMNYQRSPAQHSSRRLPASRRTQNPAILEQSTFSKVRGTARDEQDPSDVTGSAAGPFQRGNISTNFPKEPIPTPLWLAVSQEYLPGIRALIDAGASSEDVRDCVKFGFQKGKIESLKQLVQGSFEHFIFLLSLAEEGNARIHSGKILDQVLTSCEWNRDQTSEILEHLIRRHDVELLRRVIEKRLLLNDDVDEREEKIGLLTFACIEAVNSRDLEALQLLQASGADLASDVQATLGKFNPVQVQCTLLHLAAHLNDLLMAAFFLKNYPESNVFDELGRTPLHYTVHHEGAKDMIDLLCTQKHVLDIKDGKGWTPLHTACHYGIQSSVEALLLAGAQVNALDGEERSPLHHCAFTTSKAESLLLDYGASPDALDKYGLNASQLSLINSVKEFYPRVNEIIKKQPALLSARMGLSKRTILHFAAEADCSSSVLSMLITRGADMEAEDTDGKTPMQIAAPQAAQHLIRQGARWK